jgi:peptidylprolyl isomerase
MQKQNHALIFACFLLSTFSFAQKNEELKRVLNKDITTASGLKYKFTKLGDGAKAETGDVVTVNYIGKLANDSVFTDSYKQQNPFTFKLGQGKAIKGFDEAVSMMQIGDKLKVVIPPGIAYGKTGAGMFAPNSTLKFEIELMSFEQGLRPYDCKGKDTVKLASGVKYITILKGDGPNAVAGDMVTLHFAGYLPDGKMFDNSIERKQPYTWPLGKGLPGLDEAIMQMSKGGKARVVVPYLLGFGENGRPGQIPPKTDCIFDIELLDVKPKVVPVLFDTKGKDTITTSSGLKYIIVTKTGGAKVAPGKTVIANYSGYLLDGKMFDSSVERGQPFEFTLGSGQVIKGWDESFGLMNTGEKWRIILPPSIAYGANGQPPVIPANATLIFDVELIGTK